MPVPAAASRGEGKRRIAYSVKCVSKLQKGCRTTEYTETTEEITRVRNLASCTLVSPLGCLATEFAEPQSAQSPQRIFVKVKNGKASAFTIHSALCDLRDSIPLPSKLQKTRKSPRSIVAWTMIDIPHL